MELNYIKYEYSVSVCFFKHLLPLLYSDGCRDLEGRRERDEIKLGLMLQGPSPNILMLRQGARSLCVLTQDIKEGLIAKKKKKLLH